MGLPGMTDAEVRRGDETFKARARADSPFLIDLTQGYLPKVGDVLTFHDQTYTLKDVRPIAGRLGEIHHYQCTVTKG